MQRANVSWAEVIKLTAQAQKCKSFEVWSDEPSLPSTRQSNAVGPPLNLYPVAIVLFTFELMDCFCTVTNWRQQKRKSKEGVSVTL